MTDRVFLRFPEFKRWRQFAMLKQDALAYDIGCSQGMFTRYERGESSMPIRHAKSIARALSKELAEHGLPTPNFSDLVA